MLELVEREQQRDGKAWRYLSFQIQEPDGKLRYEPGRLFAGVVHRRGRLGLGGPGMAAVE
ncbi:MAG: hypothetical protein H7138_23810 [Myxococcales bacterium]|nr:hypothetical protein [Myxococcales bacterium]